MNSLTHLENISIKKIGVTPKGQPYMVYINNENGNKCSTFISRDRFNEILKTLLRMKGYPCNVVYGAKQTANKLGMEITTNNCDRLQGTEEVRAFCDRYQKAIHLPVTTTKDGIYVGTHKMNAIGHNCGDYQHRTELCKHAIAFYLHFGCHPKEYRFPTRYELMELDELDAIAEDARMAIGV